MAAAHLPDVLAALCAHRAALAALTDEVAVGIDAEQAVGLLMLLLAAEVDYEASPLRRAATTWAEVAGLSEDAIYDLELTLGEAAANVVDHAYPVGEDMARF